MEVGLSLSTTAQTGDYGKTAGEQRKCGWFGNFFQLKLYGIDATASPVRSVVEAGKVVQRMVGHIERRKLGDRKIAHADKGRSAIERDGSRVLRRRRAVIPAKRQFGSEHVDSGDQAEAERINPGSQNCPGLTDSRDYPVVGIGLVHDYGSDLVSYDIPAVGAAGVERPIRKRAVLLKICVVSEKVAGKSVGYLPGNQGRTDDGVRPHQLERSHQ